MNAKRDPLLESLFDEAKQDLADSRFTRDVLDNVRNRGKRILWTRLAVIALLIALEVLLESPVQQSLGAVAEVLGRSLVSVDHEWLEFIVGPINSIAGLVGIALLGINALYRRIVY